MHSLLFQVLALMQQYHPACANPKHLAHAAEEESLTLSGTVQEAVV